MERMKPAESIADVLSAHEKDVMARVLAEEAARREHAVVYLSGAHAYGFPSPDSDLDLKAIHVARTADLLGFDVPAATVDRAEIIEGVEIDYTSNELGHALSGILAGNGNFLERVLGRMVALGSDLMSELVPLARRSLSRRVHRHYRGFAQNQLRFLEKEPTAKKLLYVLRTSLTGIHLLQTGELEADLTRLMDDHGLSDAALVVERKLAGEHVGVDPSLLAEWRPRVDDLFARLDRARETSRLPEEPQNVAEVREWLLAVRRTRFKLPTAGREHGGPPRQPHAPSDTGTPHPRPDPIASWASIERGRNSRGERTRAGGASNRRVDASAPRPRAGMPSRPPAQTSNAGRTRSEQRHARLAPIPTRGLRHPGAAPPSKSPRRPRSLQSSWHACSTCCRGSYFRHRKSRWRLSAGAWSYAALTADLACANRP